MARRDPHLRIALTLAAGYLRDLDPRSGYSAMIQDAAARIALWLPKGVHFGWETSFRNKGKFPAWMSKEEARRLVVRLLETAPLQVHPNRRDGITASGELRVVADALEPVGTRGQRRVRVVIVRDAFGHVVENAFPVHEH